MAKGKGSAPASPEPTPVTPTYTDPVSARVFTTPDDLNNEITSREQTAAAQQTASDIQNAGSVAAQTADYSGRATSARGNAETAISRYFSNQGLDPNKYWASDITPALDTEAASIQPNDPNPQAAYSPNLGAQIVSDLTSGKRSQATNAISKEFGPTYAADALPYTADDPTIDTLLNSQFDPLMAQLTNAQKRNTLNDTGYSAALDALNTAKTGARSTVSSLGTGIIDKDRSGLNDYITSAKNDAAALPLANADSFDPTSYLTGAQGRTAAYLSSLPGDLTNAVGGTKFSDLTTLLNAGGSVQGAYDPTATNPNSSTPSPQYIADQVLANTKRGVGSTGAF